MERWLVRFGQYCEAATRFMRDPNGYTGLHLKSAEGAYQTAMEELERFNNLNRRQDTAGLIATFRKGERTIRGLLTPSGSSLPDPALSSEPVFF